MHSVTSTQRKNMSSTEYNFSLLADPKKIKNIDKTVVVKNVKNNNDSDSVKSNLMDINNPDSDLQFKISEGSRRSSKSSVSSKSSISSSKSVSPCLSSLTMYSIDLGRNGEQKAQMQVDW